VISLQVAGAVPHSLHAGERASRALSAAADDRIAQSQSLSRIKAGESKQERRGFEQKKCEDVTLGLGDAHTERVGL